MTDEVLKWGLWVYKIPNIPRGTEPPQIFTKWRRYFMWINKGTIYYGEEEGRPSHDIPVAACRSADRYDPNEFALKKGRDAPSMLTDFAWVLKTVEFSTIFVSDSESQCQTWVDGINAMLPGRANMNNNNNHNTSTSNGFNGGGHQRTLSGYNNPMMSGSAYNTPQQQPLNGHHHQRSHSGYNNNAFGGGGGPTAHEEDLFTMDPSSILSASSGRHGGRSPGGYASPMHGRSSSQGHFHDPTYHSMYGGGNQLVPQMSSSGYRQTSNYATLDGPASPHHGRGFSQQQQFGALVVQGGGGGGGSGYPSGSGSPATRGLGSPNSHHLDRFQQQQQQRIDEEAMDIVAMGTWVQKIKGDNADKEKTSFGGCSWAPKWIWMEGANLFYGAQKGDRERMIPVNKCTSVERLGEEEMFGYKAPNHLHRFGVRLRAPGKCYVVAAESELAAQGWFKVWKKQIPLTAEEIASEVQKTYEESIAHEEYYSQQSREGDERRKREQALKKQNDEAKKREEDKMKQQLEFMAKSLQLVTQANAEKEKAEQERNSYIQRETAAREKQEADRRQAEEEYRREQERRKQEEDSKKREEDLKRQMETDLQKRLAKQRIKDLETSNKIVEQEVERRLLEMKLKQFEEEAARKKKEEEDARKAEEDRKRQEAERERLRLELEEEDRRMAEVHQAMLDRQKKQNTGCCVVM